MAKQFTSLFLLRRLVFAFTVILIPRDSGIQFNILTQATFFQMLYLLVFQPIRDKTANKIEFFNEMNVLGLSYFMVGFSDFQPDPFLSLQLAKLYCSSIIIFVFVNFAFITTRLAKQKFLKKCRKKKKEERKEINLKPKKQKITALKIEELESVDDSQRRLKNNSDERKQKQTSAALLMVPEKKSLKEKRLQPQSFQISYSSS